ncbi:MAG: radical SAM protein [Gammaproteobacteria bacterium]|nr:radical SAM protein [Gammaproteobacteria bacterium]MCK5668924.1 radical SAM protein [Gammaproteobacteria bacterium]
MLTTTDHGRDSAGLTYVYPVISRRSGGLSIGINLNPNNACNWRCIYCQVPDLKRGSSPKIELQQLKDELDGFLNDVIHGDFYDHYDVAEDLRTIKDIAISGNGEPTSAADFDQVVELIVQSIRQFDLHDKIKLVLITNGSLAHKKIVQSGLSTMNKINGEVWFKLDSATDTGLKTINNAGLSVDKVKENLKIMSALCPTWLQTCVFKLDGEYLSDNERGSYLQFLSWLKEEGIKIYGVLLYGLARPSMQVEAPRLSAVSAEWMEEFANELRQLDFLVRNNL